MRQNKFEWRFFMKTVMQHHFALFQTREHPFFLKYCELLKKSFITKVSLVGWFVAWSAGRLVGLFFINEYKNHRGIKNSKLRV
jgi:hypothetical protein